MQVGVLHHSRVLKHGLSEFDPAGVVIVWLVLHTKEEHIARRVLAQPTEDVRHCCPHARDAQTGA